MNKKLPIGGQRDKKKGQEFLTITHINNSNLVLQSLGKCFKILILEYNLSDSRIIIQEQHIK